MKKSTAVRVRKIKDFGLYREIENYITAPMLGNHSSRSGRVKKTVAAVAKANDRHTVEAVEDKIKANFHPRDWFLTLTYWDGELPNEEQRAKKDLRNFLDAIKRICTKKGIDFKWLKTTERGQRNGRLHHHLVIPGGITLEEIESKWRHGSVFPRRLWADGNNQRDGDRLNVHNLAEYFVGIHKRGKASHERPQNKKRYSFSRNCIEPKITYEAMSPKWLNVPRAPEGWKIAPGSLCEYTDAYGLRHQRYVILRC